MTSQAKILPSSQWTAAIPAKNLVPCNQNWSSVVVYGVSPKECAEYCQDFFDKNEQNQKDLILGYVSGLGVDMPKSANGWYSERARLVCAKWWNRQLKKRNIRAAEYSRIKSLKVQKYCSDKLLEMVRERKTNLLNWIDKTVLEGSNGEQLELKKVVDSSLSNTKNRRAELMARIEGIERYAAYFGYVGRFITVTAYSRCHRNSGDKWNGYTPKQVQKYLTDTWAKCRAKLKRQSIEFLGVRITEPHKDACPHWHLLAFFKTSKQAKIGIKTIREYFLSVDGDELGALQNRIKTVSINPLKGSASGYVAKYICKNIDGDYVGDMLDKNGQRVTDGVDGAARVVAWASCWAARQFQFIGGAPIGVWRELRRIREAKNAPQKLESFVLWYCADIGDYCAFLMAYKAAQKEGKQPVIKKYGFLDDVAKLKEKYGSNENIPDDELSALKTYNQYGEPTYKTIGLNIGNDFIKTRSGVAWVMKTANKDLVLDTQSALEVFTDLNQDSPNLLNDVLGYALKIGAWGGRAVGRGLSDLWQ